MERESVQGTNYKKVAVDYFEKRGLQRHAGSWGLWGLGVAAIIS